MQTQSEKLANDRLRAHQITREIITFGVSNNTIINIMFNLAMNVENIEQSQMLMAAIKEIAPQAFITTMFEGVNAE